MENVNKNIITHADLVKRAGKWLRNSIGCSTVFEELVSATTEIPDAIGWSSGRCILVECKTSVADFRADKKKWHRSHGSDNAIGNWRFYLSPPGVIPVDEIPEGWGLYEVDGRRVVHVFGEQYANMGPMPFESSANKEKTMLLSAIRRLQASMCVYIREETELDE